MSGAAGHDGSVPGSAAMPALQSQPVVMSDAPHQGHGCNSNDSGSAGDHVGIDEAAAVAVAAEQHGSPVGSGSSYSPPGTTHVEESHDSMPFSPPSLGPAVHRSPKAQAFASAPVASFGVAGLEARRFRPASPSNSPSTPPPTWGTGRRRGKGRIPTPPSAPVSTTTRRLFDVAVSVPTMPPLHGGSFRAVKGPSSLAGTGILSERAGARFSAYSSIHTRLSRANGPVDHNAVSNGATGSGFSDLAARTASERAAKRSSRGRIDASAAAAAGPSPSSGRSSAFVVSASSSASSARHHSPGSVGAKGFREGAGLFDDVTPALRPSTAVSSTGTSRPNSRAALPSPSSCSSSGINVAEVGISASDLGAMAAGSVLSDQASSPRGGTGSQDHEGEQLAGQGVLGAGNRDSPPRSPEHAIQADLRGTALSADTLTVDAQGLSLSSSSPSPLDDHHQASDADMIGWAEAFDESSGFAYYTRINPISNQEESRWAEASDWERGVDPDSQFPYLCNRYTGETAWEHEEALATASPSLQLVLGPQAAESSPVDVDAHPASAVANAGASLHLHSEASEAALVTAVSPVMSPSRKMQGVDPTENSLNPLTRAVSDMVTDPLRHHHNATTVASKIGGVSDSGQSVVYAKAPAWSSTMPDVQASQWDTDDAASANSGSINAYASGYEATDDDARAASAEPDSHHDSDSEKQHPAAGMSASAISRGAATLRVRTPGRPIGARRASQADSVTSSEMEPASTTPMHAEVESHIRRDSSRLPPRPATAASSSSSLHETGPPLHAGSPQTGALVPKSAARRRRGRSRVSSSYPVGSSPTFDSPSKHQQQHILPSPLGSAAHSEADISPLPQPASPPQPPGPPTPGHNAHTPSTPQSAWSAPLPPHSHPYGYAQTGAYPPMSPHYPYHMTMPHHDGSPSVNQPGTPSSQSSRFQHGPASAESTPHHQHHHHHPVDPRFAHSPAAGGVGVAYMPGPYGYPMPVQVPVMHPQHMQPPLDGSPTSSHHPPHPAMAAPGYPGYPPGYYPGMPSPYLYSHPSGMYSPPHQMPYQQHPLLPQVADAADFARPGKRAGTKTGRRRIIEQLGLTGSRRDSARAIQGAAIAASQRRTAAAGAGSAAQMARRLDFGGPGGGSERGGAASGSRAEQIRALASLLRASASAGGRGRGDTGKSSRRGTGSSRSGRSRGVDDRRSSRRRRQRELAWDGEEDDSGGEHSDFHDDAKRIDGFSKARGLRTSDIEAGKPTSPHRRSKSRSAGRPRASFKERKSHGNGQTSYDRAGEDSGSTGSSSYGTDDVASDLENEEASGSGVWGITAAIGSLFGSAAEPSPRQSKSSQSKRRQTAKHGALDRRTNPSQGNASPARLQTARGAPPPPESDLAEEDTGFAGRVSTAGAVADEELKMSVGGVEVGLTLQERIAQIGGALGAVGSAAAEALAATGVPAMDGFIAAAHSGTGRLVSAIEGDEQGYGSGPVPSPWSNASSSIAAAPMLGASAASFGGAGKRRSGHRGSARGRASTTDSAGAAVPAQIGRPVLANPIRTSAVSSAAGVLPFARPSDDTHGSGSVSSLTSSPVLATSGKRQQASSMAKRGPNVRSQAAAEAGWGAGPANATKSKQGSHRSRATSNESGDTGRDGTPESFKHKQGDSPGDEYDGEDMVEATDVLARPPSAAFEAGVSAEEAADFDAAIV